MLTIQQRHDLANSLQKLKEKLQPYSSETIHQLPKELQIAVRSHKTLGPITSSGLERVDKLIKRINWAIFYLTNPRFPQDFQQPTNPPAQPDKPTAPPPTTPPTPPPAELDFGPFDPRSV